MSDIHGCYNEYMEMLVKIKFSENDTLYILGDIIDRKKGGFKILHDMMSRHNIIPILGNHEYVASIALPCLLKEVTEDTIKSLDLEKIQAITEWLNIGGDVSISEFYKLNTEEREDILEYISEFRLFEELSVNGNEFVLVHAGLDNFSIDRCMDNYDSSELIFTPCDYSKIYFPEKYLVTGHIPTRTIFALDKGLLLDEIDPKDYRDDIYIGNKHIGLDCGSGYDGKLGCICLDTFETFYV